jgi:hypothetical protein
MTGNMKNICKIITKYAAILALSVSTVLFLLEALFAKKPAL